jgi:hypothetical protein
MRREPQRHLTEDEFVDFVLEETPEEMEKEIDMHLESCVDCTKRLEAFYTAQENFPHKAWAARRETFVENLRQRIFGPWEKLRDFLKRISYPITLGEAFSTPAHTLDLESEDGVYGAFIEQKPNGDVKVFLESNAPELEGTMVHLYAGNWERSVQLDRVDEDYVGAEIVITRDERSRLPDDTVLRAELIDEDKSFE